MIIWEVEEVPIGVRTPAEWRKLLPTHVTRNLHEWGNVQIQTIDVVLRSASDTVIATTPLFIYIEGEIELAFMKKKTIWAARHRILGLDASFVDLLIDNISHDQLAQLLQGCTSNHLFDESFISYKKLFLLQGMPFYQNDSWWIQRKYASSDCVIFSHKHKDPSLLQTISISFSDPISYTFDENKPLLFS